MGREGRRICKSFYLDHVTNELSLRNRLGYPKYHAPEDGPTRVDRGGFSAVDVRHLQSLLLSRAQQVVDRDRSRVYLRPVLVVAVNAC